MSFRFLRLSLSRTPYSLWENLDGHDQVTFLLKCLGLMTDGETSNGGAGKGQSLGGTVVGRVNFVGSLAQGVFEVGHGGTGDELSSFLVIVGEW